ncbi:hypothetical protein [Salirhabdus sp. Marseille-P4669]|uniref:hypothetical protein n=1 Tax=Salirhabdus sp. Marseille-P4669 TaxID=2042310 RepID=UPI000C7D5314|nr:hypothetical protein [Salirhabdus sp. Marseille-P4669]
MRKLLFSIILLFICGAVFYYIDPLKMFTIEDAKIQELIDSDYKLDIGDSEETKEQEGGAQDLNHGVPQMGALDPATAKRTIPAPNKDTETLTEDTIVRKYEASLNSLQEQVEHKLNELMNHAYDEYTADKNDDGEANVMTLYLKYQKAITELENNTDESFNEVYEQMQAELKENGHNPVLADDLKDQYEAMKKETRSVMMDKVLDKFEV